MNLKHKKGELLIIGCGPKSRWINDPKNLSVGIDLVDFGQKYVGDYLNYKFKKKFKVILAHHLIEHIPDTVAFFDKVSQDLVEGGYLDIRVPLMQYEFAFVDPTHVKFIPSETFFKYFTKDSPAGHPYSKGLFEIVEVDRGRYEWELHVLMKYVCPTSVSSSFSSNGK